MPNASLRAEMRLDNLHAWILPMITNGSNVRFNGATPLEVCDSRPNDPDETDRVSFVIGTGQCRLLLNEGDQVSLRLYLALHDQPGPGSARLFLDPDAIVDYADPTKTLCNGAALSIWKIGDLPD